MTLVLAEPSLDVEPHGLRQKHAVPNLEMGIEREVNAVEGDIRLDQGSNPTFVATDDGLEAAPEESVMYDHQVGPEFGRGPNRRFRRIDGGRHRADLMGTSDLKPIQGGRIVGVVGDLEPAVQILEH